MNVIPKVGQVWANVSGGKCLVERISENGTVYFAANYAATIHKDVMIQQFTFKPANNLEWLAVNYKEWTNSIAVYIEKDGEGWLLFDKNFDGSCYTRQQWQDKRNELFGLEEAKMKTKVKYVKCKESLNDIAKAMIDGETLYLEEGVNAFFWSGSEFVDNDGGGICVAGEFYRRVETEVTWQDELEEFIKNKRIDGAFIKNLTIDTPETPQAGIGMTMSMQFGDFIEMCNLVSEANK